MTLSKLLYVDDEEISLELFTINFKKYFDVHTASSGEDGLKILQKNPDIYLVLTDMNMPLMSGLEFIHEAIKINPKASYFLLTGYDLKGEIKQAVESGLITKFFQKPYDRSDLMTTLQKVNG
jgi:two-component system, response regulator, stage 0 sporulation protein F